VANFKELNTPRNGILLQYGGEAGCSTSVSIVCDPASDVGNPALAQPFDPNTCFLNATWNTKYGCVKCTLNDYQSIDSPCQPSSGSFFITRTWFQTNAFCYGGVSLPAPQQSQCQCALNDPCDPVTTCVDYFGGFNCTACPARYSGTGATKCVPLCNPPCQHQGTCLFPDVCICANTGYTSRFCEVPVCDPPCLNGGRCTAPNTCNCFGYNGTICERPICTPLCANGGVCAASNVCDCSATGKVGVLCDEDAIAGVSHGVVAALVLVGVVLIALAIAALAILYIRHRKLYAQYSKLSSNIPMDEDDQ